ncbi:molybdopterin-dependent oxidoreductase [Jidongwangia harbinensis]|uniref:molybdopterin-dependent oxidoreductase n=1 Tax=Jidongwangia harbinensis TaxID=2878561 RepID=UPI001CD994DF|nr:molybdopterin-dependent oxidoreductase [Jidongwangia harbinensis]MCA2218604.1 molybdopterin-dependent oxidoreductase [Jidongwangia harbinensis]
MKLSVRAGLSGVAAAAVALGLAEVVAVWTGPLSAPLLAVGGVVVDSVPAPVKDAGIAVFGVHDKTALITGTAILLAGYAWLLGLVARRSWRLALAGIALFGLIGVAAAVTRHDAGPLTALPSVVGAAVAVPVLGYLLSLAGARTRPVPSALAGAPGASVMPDSSAGASAPVEPSASGVPAASGVAGVAGVPAVSGVAGVAGVSGTSAMPDALAESGVGAAGGRRAGARADGPGEGGTQAAVGGPESAYPGGGDLVVPSRRRFLQVLGIAAGVAAVGGVGGRLLTSRRAVAAARAAVVLPPAVRQAPVTPANAQAPGAVAYVTSNADFYRIDTSLYPPQIDPAGWELRIHGLVRNPITLTWDQLLRRPMVERYVTLACVSNEVGGDLIGNALWLGTPIKALLDEADPLPDADQVVQRSIDGWTCGSPTAQLRDGRDALLAVGMNGAPLPVEHGFPARMVVPGLYGYVSACKWITEIELTRFADFDAYWVPRGWSAQAPIKTQSRIDTPRDGAGRRAGAVTVAGVAWAQHRGIARVEVQVDDGPWQAATLAGTVSTDTWRQWSWSWPATPGRHTLRVRATDTTGATQTDRTAPPAPDGATGRHTIDVTIE